jgi:16S rRNA C967 or C1407 C5-methylase (RsmB/RsmF family)
MIVYLTCSLEPEEDGEQVDLFLERHSSFERDRDDLLVFPPDTGTDGGFGACMRRVR